MSGLNELLAYENRSIDGAKENRGKLIFLIFISENKNIIMYQIQVQVI